MMRWFLRLQDSPYWWGFLAALAFIGFCTDIYLMHYDAAYISIAALAIDLFFLGYALRKRGGR